MSVIQWYPGHMTRAKRAMTEDLKKVDLVIELLDARIPRSSENPDIAVLAAGKSRLIVLNKADLADPGLTEAWRAFFREEGVASVALDSRGNTVKKAVEAAITSVSSPKLERDRKRGILNSRIRAMVVGIPNVGKSTFINLLAGRGTAKTGNEPGVTRGNQWIRLNASVDLLDTPGILWPKFDDPSVGLHLASTGAIPKEVFDPVETAAKLLQELAVLRPEFFPERFGVPLAEEEDFGRLLERIAGAKGCMKKGGLPDTLRMARQILDQFKNGKLGRITLEVPAERSKSS